ncbi:MAG: bacteriocin family protein [Alphaproteobacteria bacterium]|nr:bacteriocin family protein [Alphaproteobacteria bacterium]
MNDLRRNLAPFSAEVWSEIDDEAKRVLKLHLAARKLVDFNGPLGWGTSAIDIGWTKALQEAPAAAVSAHLRLPQPLVELRAPFTMAMKDIRAIERGAKDADLGPVVDAAKAIARAEDHAVFHGFAAAGIKGIVQASAEATVSLSGDYLKYPASVLEATEKLRAAGIDGPYGIALGPRCHAGLLRTLTPAGVPILDHVRKLLDGPIVWAPAVDGAVVLSLRGDDFELTVGRDMSVGYRYHTADAVELYIEESITFRPLTPEAAVPLVYGKAK